MRPLPFAAGQDGERIRIWLTELTHIPLSAYLRPLVTAGRELRRPTGGRRWECHVVRLRYLAVAAVINELATKRRNTDAARTTAPDKRRLDHLSAWTAIRVVRSRSPDHDADADGAGVVGVPECGCGSNTGLVLSSWRGSWPEPPKVSHGGGAPAGYLPRVFPV